MGLNQALIRKRVVPFAGHNQVIQNLDFQQLSSISHLAQVFRFGTLVTSPAGSLQTAAHIFIAEIGPAKFTTLDPGENFFMNKVSMTFLLRPVKRCSGHGHPA